MWTVKKLSQLSGVSVRALHHYDAIGLLKPSEVTEAGYRLYREESLERLGEILLFKELGFSLQEIREILENPDFEREKALTQQIELLSLQKKRLEDIIALAEQIKKTGVYRMDFKVFDREEIDRYQAEAKRQWGSTEAFREYEEKSAGRTADQQRELAADMMQIFGEFGALRNEAPDSPAALSLVRKLKDFISAHYYSCTKTVLSGLGQMYAAGGEMGANIDAAGGEGTAQFAAAAIEAYCRTAYGRGGVNAMPFKKVL